MTDTRKFKFLMMSFSQKLKISQNPLFVPKKDSVLRARNSQITNISPFLGYQKDYPSRKSIYFEIVLHQYSACMRLVAIETINSMSLECHEKDCHVL
jgi:hypothetical protein